MLEIDHLPTKEEVQKSLIARREFLARLVKMPAGIGIGLVLAYTGAKTFEDDVNKTKSETSPKPELPLKLGENKIENPGFEFNPSTDPIPTFWTLRPDNQHIRVSEKERTPADHNSIEVEGFYDEKGRFQTPILETANAIPVDISHDSFDYKLSFKAKVPQGFRPVIIVRPTVPDYSPNGTYQIIGNPARYSPENNTPGNWNEKPYEFTINNSHLPKETKGVVIQLALASSSNITLNSVAGSKSYFGEISLNEVENPLRGKQQSSM